MTELGRRWTVATSIPVGVSHPISAPGAKYVRLRLVLEQPGAEPWLLTLRDETFRPIQTLRPGDFAADRSRWSERLAGSLAWAELETSGSTNPPRIEVREFLAMPDGSQKPTYYTVNPAAGNQFRPLFDSNVPSYVQQLGDAVGMIMSSWNTDAWCCSGVLISDGLFLTNWHCGGPPELVTSGYWNSQVCRDTIIDMSWDGDGVSREFVCTAVEFTDEIHDVAILRVSPLDQRGMPRPARLAKTVGSGSLTIVHHPACRPKHVTQACPMVDATRTSWRGGVPAVDLSHRCDTEGGSSGAPIFNEQGEVVGLHHLGFAVDERSCRYADDLNKAIRIDAILRLLRAKRPDLEAVLSVR
jgi:hypothetical protein